MAGDSALLIGVLGLLLTLLTLVLPMTQWQVPPIVARCIAAGAIAAIVYSIGTVIWYSRHRFSAPLSYAAEVLSWPGTRSVLSQFCVILVVLIFVEWVQVRPFYRDLRSLQTAMKRYVLPRHLTDAQISTIANYLSQHEPQKIKMIQLKNNEESSAYRADFQNALTRGGWTIVAIDVSDDLPEGVCTNFVQTMASAQRQPDPKHPNANELLQEALRQAQVKLNQTSGGSGQSTTSDSLTLTIGRRRVDDSDIRGREATMEMYRRLLKEQQDE
jgi:hypothetical protein